MIRISAGSIDVGDAVVYVTGWPARHVLDDAIIRRTRAAANTAAWRTVAR